MTSEPARLTGGFRGTIVHCLSEQQLEIVEDALLLVRDGLVLHLGPANNAARIVAEHNMDMENVRVLDRHEFVMPGLVDAHIHACQYPNIGLGHDLPLLQWLSTYTFPLEARFADQQFASAAYDSVVGRSLAAGTTCASYFASIHRPACETLADACVTHGQRALVGKTCMDRNAPDFYCERTDTSVSEARAFVQTLCHSQATHYRATTCPNTLPLVQPSITPRFAISCTRRLLEELGALASEQQLHVQSHLDESEPEVQLVRQLFPEASCYADVYRAAGLLGERTVMAHVVHTRREGLELLQRSATGVAHCPHSNITLQSGLCDVNVLSDSGINVGLGSDVSGGFRLSVLEGMRGAIATSKVLAILARIQPEHVVDYKRALYMATLGGARALGLQQHIGNFAIGKQFDALVVNLAHSGSSIDILMPLSAEQIVQKFISLGGASEIMHVYVAGRRVAGFCDEH